MGNEKAVVLLIDDDDAIVEEMLTFMGLHGVMAIGVSNLDDAMTALQANPSIRVLSCDVRLGRDSGLSIVTRIQEHATLRARPFRYLFLSGYQLLPAQLMMMLEHIVLTKPVRPQVLIDVLNDLLGAFEEPALAVGVQDETEPEHVARHRRLESFAAREAAVLVGKS
ncbi:MULTISPECIES: response regulator [unclassified Novosphingobium]|uniref:response regulator n=1 Tax=unclassified Novosphingobium TaxID=2644732 RepID=UPI00190F736C|nr:MULTISPECIES: response regulator [unclassified Novosphingobium]